VQSGPFLRGFSRERATQNARRLLDNLNIPHAQAARLQQTPAEEIVQAFTSDASLGAYAFAPVVDGLALPRDPFSPDATPVARDIPLLIGSNADEMTLFSQDPALLTMSWEDLPRRAGALLPGSDVAHIIDVFRRGRPQASPYQVFQAIGAERLMGANSKILAERKAAQGGAPVYSYFFTWESPVDGGRWGSAHSLEIPFVFDTLGRSESFVGPHPPQSLADKMSDAWLAFARVGDPSTTALPDWPRFEASRRATMVFDVEPRVVDDPNGEERQLLAGLPPMR